MKKSIVALRLALYGCKNRPFFYLVASHRKKARNRGYFEQIGTYDPLPNDRNEKLISLNVDRIKYWLSVGAEPTRPVAMLLGLAGILPVHPHSIEIASRNRDAIAKGEATATDVEKMGEEEKEK
ncbi:probable 28S ribosomal protein S16, mitochondrial [Nematostella vectensis]|uniref:probable 28S ribosomal protein S16, mitochondrial n=1 Tax=Nematostella vectensis TaxID=45351 RepID=UPI0020778D68|nr:probable 28S ribosomal protein S16, mitochondrial [Nematostella vectensis]